MGNRAASAKAPAPLESCRRLTLGQASRLMGTSGIGRLLGGSVLILTLAALGVLSEGAGQESLAEAGLSSLQNNGVHSVIRRNAAVKGGKKENSKKKSSKKKKKESKKGKKSKRKLTRRKPTKGRKGQKKKKGFTEAESNMNDLVSEYQQYQDA